MSAESSGKTAIVAWGGTGGGDIDADLRAIIDAWAGLPEPAKASIVAIAREAHVSGE